MQSPHVLELIKTLGWDVENKHGHGLTPDEIKIVERGIG
jgi:hypothetical protein